MCMSTKHNRAVFDTTGYLTIIDDGSQYEQNDYQRR